MARSRVSLRDWPRLTRFYGIPPSELARMPHILLEMYAEQLMELTSEEAMHGFLTADIPHAGKADRARIFRSFERYLAKPEAEPVDARTDEGRGVLAGLGIGVDIPEATVESSVEPTDA